MFSIAAAIGIGVMIAAQLGPAMVDPLFFIPFACLSAFLAGQSVATEPLMTPPRIGLAVLRSCGFMAATLAVGLALVNLDPPRRLPDWQTAIAAGVLSISVAFLAACCASWISQRFSPNAARWTIRAAMLALYCFYRWMPGEWLAWVNEQARSDIVKNTSNCI